MTDLRYHRPKTMKEALALLDQGIPLAGGTALVPDLKPDQVVIDLQDLGLDTIKPAKDAIRIGAAATLQALLDSGASIPAALTAACHLEANHNLRNMATLGGTIMSADGRSPLLTALLALDVHLQLEPGRESLPLDSLLERRHQQGFGSLITEITIPTNAPLAYDQVARAPYDRPIVCAAVGGLDEVQVVLGGFGPRPRHVIKAEEALSTGGGIEAAAAAARELYADADDHRASGEYRGHAAGVLVKRLLTEVMA